MPSSLKFKIQTALYESMFYLSSLSHQLACLKYRSKKNQTKVDGFLKKQGINVQTVNHKDYANMSLEELMESKELIEDLIAEKEVNVESTMEATAYAE